MTIQERFERAREWLTRERLRLAWYVAWGLASLSAATAGVVIAAQQALGDTQPLGLMVGAGVLLLVAAAPRWLGPARRHVRRFWLEIVFTSLALATLWVAGAVTIGLSRMMSWREEPDIALPIFFLVLASAYGLAAANRGLRPFWNWLREPWEWLRRFFTFFVFTGIAAGNGFLVWRLFEDGELKNTSTAILVVLAIVSVLLAVWGRDILLRIKSIGTAGVELYAWEETTAASDFPKLSLPALIRPDLERVDLSKKELWTYELGTSVLRHFRHSGIDASRLEGRELARFRRLVVWVGRAALNHKEDFNAFEILRSIEYLATLDDDELFFLGVAYSRIGIAEDDKERSSDRFQHARKLLERAIRQNPNNAKAHFTLASANYHLGQYGRSIKGNDKVILLEEGLLANYARWNKALSLLARGEGDKALETLKEIPKVADLHEGKKIWEDMKNDVELQKELRALRLGGKFATIYDQKTN